MPPPMLHPRRGVAPSVILPRGQNATSPIPYGNGGGKNPFPKAFPLRGRWRGEAVTDEVA